ncbi:MAG: hypothetical protein FJZ01_09865 [Candidatus Sericytochromatia bacterium]|nr:hypothetical protein [Candidatus Tanganyikabacteria bacterium]
MTSNSILVRFVAALVTALGMLVAWEDLAFAGEAPGEGFTASVLAILVVALQFVVLGRAEVGQRFFPGLPFGALAAGSALLLAVAAGPLAWGLPLLAPFKFGLGPLSLSSSTLFDLAVFLIVGGGMLAAFAGLPIEAPVQTGPPESHS